MHIDFVHLRPNLHIHNVQIWPLSSKISSQEIIIINVKGCSLNFFPRYEWTTANAKITFDKIQARVGRGEFDTGTGIFKCGQAGGQLSLSNLILTILILTWLLLKH